MDGEACASTPIVGRAALAFVEEQHSCAGLSLIVPSDSLVGVGGVSLLL
jgi:hypothetical protein